MKDEKVLYEPMSDPLDHISTHSESVRLRQALKHLGAGKSELTTPGERRELRRLGYAEFIPGKEAHYFSRPTSAGFELLKLLK